MIPVYKPDLPTTEELKPYLDRIKDNEWATNDGPLVRELEDRLGGVAVANATLGLAMLIQSQHRRSVEVRIPSFTFAATAHAVTLAGRQPPDRCP